MENNNNPIDPVSFAQGLRATYPGAFDSIKDDYALTKGFIDTHPEAADKVDFGPQKPSPSKEESKQAGPEQAAQPQEELTNPLELMMGEGMGSPLSKAGMIASGLEGVARVGRFAAGGLQKLGGLAEEAGIPGAKTGSKALSTLLIPQNKLAVAMSSLNLTDEELGRQILAKAGKTVVKKAGTVAKISGSLASVTSRVDPKKAALVFEDPTILDESVTPGIKEVSREFGEYFAKKGVKINSQTLQELSDKGYFPNENQIETLRKTILKPVLDKIEAGIVPSEAELIFAERAANAMTRSTSAQANRTLMSYASGAKAALTEQLEKHGFNDLPDLKAKYVRALAQEEFKSLLPKNKSGSPNALSALLMGRAIKNSLGNLAQGNISGAVSEGAQAAAFSPLAIGSAISGASKAAPGIGGAIKAGALGALNVSDRTRKDKKK